jgi:site-specific recombinase XerD
LVKSGTIAQVKKSSVRVRQHEILRLLDYFDAIKIKEITKKQYQDCLLDLLKKGFAENTISGIHGTAKMIFRKAIELEVIKSDPTEFARPPRKQQVLLNFSFLMSSLMTSFGIADIKNLPF